LPSVSNHLKDPELAIVIVRVPSPLSTTFRSLSVNV
jgi:hypothetical protein